MYCYESDRFENNIRINIETKNSWMAPGLDVVEDLSQNPGMRWRKILEIVMGKHFAQFSTDIVSDSYVEACVFVCCD